MGGGGKKDGPKEIPAERTRLAEPIAYYKSYTGKYPSNSQVWWGYKRPPEPGTQDPPKLYLEVFDPAIRHQLSKGSTQVAKGHYILNAFHQDRSGASGLQGLPIVSTNARPSCVAFYAGRVFYAGVNTAKFNTKIYFSQIIEKDIQVQMCYQTQDPTDEDYRDLLPTDGGVIIIPEIAEVRHMHVMGHSLLVFATNGIWEIQGSEGIGFTANDYSVAKVSSMATLSNMSFVDAEGAPVWWTRTGIWTLRPNPVGAAQVSNITDETIKTYFDSIPDMGKVTAKGTYNPVLKRIQWLFQSDRNATDFFKYDKILNFDLGVQAFWVYTPLEAENIDIRGLFTSEGYVYNRVMANVFVNDEEVLVLDEDIEVEVIDKTLSEAQYKYIIDVRDPVVPPPPPPAPPVVHKVYVINDQVFVNANEVLVSYNG